MTTTPVRDEAEALIADGWRVWPISRATRTPLRAGFSRAAGPDVCASADEFTDATEVGVLTGPCPAAGPGARFVCVDYDGPVPAEHRVGGAPTLTSKAGAHEWYRVPPGVNGFRQTQGIQRGDEWAVDTRDFGGYARETTDGEPLWDDGPVSWPRDLTQAEVDALFGPSTPPAPPPQPRPADARRVNPSERWVASFIARVIRNPDGTNECYGAAASALAENNWTNAEIEAAMCAWTPGHPTLPGRHLDSALRAADTRRAGGVIPGFPKLEKLGIPFEAEQAEALDLTTLMLEAGVTPTIADAPAGAPPFYLRSAHDIRTRELPDIQWVCEALSLAPGAPALCVGYSGVGKTTALQDLALAVATPGRKWLNYFEVRHGRVAHVDLEQGMQQTYRTYRALGISEACDGILECSVLPTWRLTDRENILALAKLATTRTLILIDSFRAACPDGDENASEYAAPMADLGRISEATGCTFVLNHHSGKNNSDRMKGARGTSAITAACSVHWAFEREDLGPATRPCLQLIKSRNHATDAMVWETWVEKVGTAESFSLHARANAGEARGLSEMQDRIVSLLATGWTGSTNDLVDELGAGRTAVFAALKVLRKNSIVAAAGALRLIEQA